MLSKGKGNRSGHRSLEAGDRAAVFVELAMITPVFMMLVLMAVEFTMWLRSHQIMSTLSSASVNSAFRDCASLSNPQSCLNQVLLNTASQVENSLPGAEVVLSIYDYNAGSGTVSRAAISGVDSVSLLTPNGNPSRFDPAAVAANLNSLSAVNNRISISEVFYEQGAIIGNLRSLYSGNPGTFYEATLY
ncbi:MAG: hypothetical protein DCC75_05085 [Proteobacteria bacterium]|nr:MAG: hypothetical protein DCC75_05085 [Pseudomonadota bacterium]